MATQPPTYDQLLVQIAALATQVANLTTNIGNIANLPAPVVQPVAQHIQFVFIGRPNPAGPSITHRNVTQLPPKGPKVATPEKYDGKKRGDRAYKFITACEQYMVMSAQQFTSDIDLINWTIGYLSEEAQKWSLIVIKDLSSATPTIDTWVKFKETFEHAFGDPDRVAKAETTLQNLQQTGSVAMYTAEFSKHAHHITWNDQALLSQYKLGLKTEIKLAKAASGWAANLINVQEEAITIDNRLFEAHAEERRQAPCPTQTLQQQPLAPPQSQQPRNVNPYLQQVLRDRAQQRPPQQQQQQPPCNQGRPGAPHDPNAMEIDQGGRRHLTEAEKQRRRQAGACLRCGQMGHFARDCRAVPLVVNAGLDRRAEPAQEGGCEARQEDRAAEMRAADEAAGRAFAGVDAQRDGQEGGTERQGNEWD